jgi:hypothetical protein
MVHCGPCPSAVYIRLHSMLQAVDICYQDVYEHLRVFIVHTLKVDA